jgi:hypothetical protein
MFIVPFSHRSLFNVRIPGNSPGFRVAPASGCGFFAFEGISLGFPEFGTRDVHR